MTTRGRGTQWYRPDYQGRETELETREEFEKRRGLGSGVMNSRFYDYADRARETCPPVKEDGRTRYFVASELDTFFDSIVGYQGPRTTAQVLHAKVARAEGTVEEHEGRVTKAEADLEKKKRQLDFHKKKLDGLRQQLAIETGITDAQQ